MKKDSHGKKVVVRVLVILLIAALIVTYAIAVVGPMIS